ncbi:hypothetical protein [Raoultella planticola]|uniref:hypothetical protein n=1 Tax=Raoultella TaxID=160674 RepID=UPI0020731E66|nr:hypothetical protein [Raoultella planticola]
MTKPTDDEILQILREHNWCMTYVVAYWLRQKHKEINTPYALRRLKKMEKAGSVKRGTSPYKKQIRWEVA